MPYRFLLSLLICLQVVHAYSQDTLCYNTKWQIGASFGYYAQLTHLFKGDVTDHLIEFDDRAGCLQLSVSYFFHKHWGIALSLQADNSESPAKKAGQFVQSLQSQYEKDYYVTASTGEDGGFSAKFPGDAGHVYVGVIYRKEAAHFFVYHKLFIGYSSFYANWGKVYLKQKNANDVIEISWTPNKIPQDNFTVAASASFGYKLSKRIFLNIEPLVSFYNTKLIYTQTTTDLNAQKTVTDIIPYKKNILGVSLTAGVVIALK